MHRTWRPPKSSTSARVCWRARASENVAAGASAATGLGVYQKPCCESPTWRAVIRRCQLCPRRRALGARYAGIVARLLPWVLQYRPCHSRGARARSEAHQRGIREQQHERSGRRGARCHGRGLAWAAQRAGRFFAHWMRLIGRVGISPGTARQIACLNFKQVVSLCLTLHYKDLQALTLQFGCAVSRHTPHCSHPLLLLHGVSWARSTEAVPKA